MKKSLLIILFVLMINISYGANLYVRGGLAPGGTIKKGGDKEKIKPSIIGNVELTLSVINMEAGVGVGYEGAPKLKNGEKLDIDMVPLYLVGKVNILGPYLVGRLGRNVPVPKGDIKDYIDQNGLKVKTGNYLSVGIGYEIALFLVEASYSISKGKIHNEELTYSKFGLMAGVKF